MDEAILNTSASEMEIYRYLAATEGVNDMGNNWSLKFNNESFYPGLMNETTEAKGVAASRIHHKEAEKRRRGRINSHLDRLRSILPCTSKTDKATLLSKVVERVLELKRQTSELNNEVDNLIIPSEKDEFSVYIDNDNESDNKKHIILKASLCCEDRADLLSDINGVLSSLKLRTLRAEMSSLGGRIQSVFMVSAESDDCAVFLRDAFKEIVQRSASHDRFKRRRRLFDTTTLHC